MKKTDKMATASEESEFEAGDEFMADRTADSAEVR